MISEFNHNLFKIQLQELASGWHWHVRLNASKANRQPDGKPDWYLERTALNKTHNQIANRRQPAIVLRVIPWMEKSIQRVRCRESTISPGRVGWCEFTVRINAIPRFRFGLWLFSLWLIIQRVFSNLRGKGECYGSSLHVPFCEGKPQERDILHF